MCRMPTHLGIYMKQKHKNIINFFWSSYYKIIILRDHTYIYIYIYIYVWAVAARSSSSFDGTIYIKPISTLGARQLPFTSKKTHESTVGGFRTGESNQNQRIKIPLNLLKFQWSNPFLESDPARQSLHAFKLLT
jgi:hypothetical protein